MSKTSLSNNQILTTTLVIIIFTLLTLADAPMYDAGIYDLFLYKDQIVARSTMDYYCSNDGGLNWNSCIFSESEYEDLLLQKSELQTHITIPNGSKQYRINDEKLIQFSDDNGQTWQYLYIYDELSNIDIYYLRNYHPYGNFSPYEGGDILYDSTNNHTIFAMGNYGVIIIDGENNFIPVAVMDYLPASIPSESLFSILVTPYILPSILITILLFGIHMLGRKGIWYRIIISLGFAVWFLSFHPYDGFSLTPYTYDLEVGLTLFSIFLINLLLLVFSFNEFLAQRKNIKSKWFTPIFGSLPAGPLFFLTFYLWFREVIPTHGWAMDISYGIVILFIIYAIYNSYQLKKSLGESNE